MRATIRSSSGLAKKNVLLLYIYIYIYKKRKKKKKKKKNADGHGHTADGCEIRGSRTTGRIPGLV